MSAASVAVGMGLRFSQNRQACPPPADRYSIQCCADAVPLGLLDRVRTSRAQGTLASVTVDCRVWCDASVLEHVEEAAGRHKMVLIA